MSSPVPLFYDMLEKFNIVKYLVCLTGKDLCLCFYFKTSSRDKIRCQKTKQHIMIGYEKSVLYFLCYNMIEYATIQ